MDENSMSKAVDVVLFEARRLGRLFPVIGEEEFVQEGMVGLLEARGRFDFNRGVQFSTYASSSIRQKMLDRVRREAPIPLSSHGRGKTSAVPVCSMEAFRDEDGAYFEGAFSGFSENPDYAEEMDMQTALSAMRELPALEQDVLRMHLEDMTLRQIGEAVSRSPEGVRLIISRALGRLRAELNVA